MSRIEKLKERLKGRPADFTWEELTRLLGSLGYEMKTGSGSRRKFRGEGLPHLSPHQPHPGNIVKLYLVKCVAETLETEGLL